MNTKETRPGGPDLSELGAVELLDVLTQRDPSFTEGSAIYDLVGLVSGLLKEMRDAAGLTQAQLAGKLSVSQGRISQIESGLPDHAPSLEMIARVGFVCGVTPTFSFDVGGPSRGKATPEGYEAFAAQMQATAVNQTAQNSAQRAKSTHGGRS